MLCNFTYAQKWEAGVMTGSNYCITETLINHDPVTRRLLPNELVAHNSIYFNYKRARQWNFEFTFNYFRITNSESVHYDPIWANYYFGPDVEGYFGTLENNNLNFGLSVYYTFLKKSHPSKFSRLHSSIGLCISYLADIQRYKALQLDTNFQITDSRTSMNKNLSYFVGLNYLISLQLSRKIEMRAKLSFTIEPDIYLPEFSPASALTNSYFQPRDLSNYYYVPPATFISWQLGIGYQL
jgi:hypothetical protein